jgi:hypothetical protein
MVDSVLNLDADDMDSGEKNDNEWCFMEISPEKS